MSLSPCWLPLPSRLTMDAAFQSSMVFPGDSSLAGGRENLRNRHTCLTCSQVTTKTPGSRRTQGLVGLYLLYTGTNPEPFQTFNLDTFQTLASEMATFYPEGAEKKTMCFTAGHTSRQYFLASRPAMTSQDCPAGLGNAFCR